MLPTNAFLRFPVLICLVLLTLFCASCKQPPNAPPAFYYWKRNFQLNKAQLETLSSLATHKLYVRFFDIKWDSSTKKPYPEAIVQFKDAVARKKITPVIFITNQTFEQLGKAAIDSLAIRTNALIEQLSVAQHISYDAIQVDCDWTLSTKNNYFHFLSALKALSKKSLEATIRLHQVKYQFKTGIPPVDRGVLMFYNMGKLSPDLKAPNSIYNPKTAANYVGSLAKYLLPLDIALPVFSWAIQIRAGKIIQVYSRIDKSQLEERKNFVPTPYKNVYRAINSFFTEGIYIKTGDLFKVEETNKELLEQAAEQLSAHLNKKEKRTIIYYELGNLNLSAFKAADLKEISAYF